MDHSEDEKETYACGADATAVRSAIRIAALRKWGIRTKDVSTAFLDADYNIKGELLVLNPPNVRQSRIGRRTRVLVSKEGNLWT